MGRHKPQTQRPRPQGAETMPQGEQQLSQSAWTQIVKAIRDLTRPARPA
jgi:hypothetical protein